MPTTVTAEELDADDPLAGYRDRFVPMPGVRAYLDGNSLGRPPRTIPGVWAELAEHGWGGRLIRGWSEGWAELPVEVGDELADAVLGSAPGQTVVGDSTTVCLYRALHAGASLRPDRDEIIVSRTAFPTDRYVAERVARDRGLVVRWLEPDLVENVTAATLAETLGPRTAVVLLDHVDYRSGTLLDLPGLTRQIHAAGAVTLWDLCHTAGLVPVTLDADEVDLAVGCTYKYLNAGPGAPAFSYVASRHQTRLDQPLAGWWSAEDMFAMREVYEPAVGIGRMLAGTPNVAGLLAVREGVALVAEAGVEAVRVKARLLGDLAVARLDEAGLTIVSPRETDRRGGHVSVGLSGARAVSETLSADGVLVDFREPDLLRLGMSPLSTSFAEVADGIDRLAAATGDVDGGPTPGPTRSAPRVGA